jgi:hypothetical protein
MMATSTERRAVHRGPHQAFAPAVVRAGRKCVRVISSPTGVVRHLALMRPRPEAPQRANSLRVDLWRRPRAPALHSSWIAPPR